MAGAYASYRLGAGFPLRLGLGAGVLLGDITYSRVGIFEDQVTGPLKQSGFFPWVYVQPEAQIGLQITEALSVGVTISAMVLVAPKIPVWTDEMAVNVHSQDTDQLGGFTADKIMSGVLFAMNQGLYVQYGF